MIISVMTLVRITRDAQVDLGEDSPAEIRAMVKEQVRQRRYEPVVRLEFGRGPIRVYARCCGNAFGLSAADVYEVDGEVDYTTLFEIAGTVSPGVARYALDSAFDADAGRGFDLFR